MSDVNSDMSDIHVNLTKEAPSSQKRSLCTFSPNKEHVARSSTQTAGVQTVSSYSTNIESVTNDQNNSSSSHSSENCQTLALVDSVLESSENSAQENKDSFDTGTAITSNVVQEINGGHGSIHIKQNTI